MKVKGIRPRGVPRQIAYRDGVGRLRALGSALDLRAPASRVPGGRALGAGRADLRLLRLRSLGIRPADVALTVVVIGAVELYVATATGAGQNPLNAEAYILGAVIALPVLLRRRFPLLALIGCSVLLVIYYTVDRRNISPAPLLALPVYDAAVAGYLAWAISIPAAFMAIGLVVVEASSHYGLAALVAEFWTSIVLLALAVALGEVVRGRHKLALETAERLRMADEEREAEAARRVAEERLRIARDLHDTVAHSMATITVQAGSALHVLSGKDPGGAPDGDEEGAGGGTGSGSGVPADDLRAALSAIRDTSKAALGEMRATLGRLRGGSGAGDVSGEAAPDGGPGGLDRLPVLCDAVTAAGAPVRLEVTGDKVALPPAVDQAAYRILQESLTNVLRHAGPDASATVRICYRPGDVVITVADDGHSGSVRSPSPADVTAAADGKAAADGTTATGETTPARETTPAEGTAPAGLGSAADAGQGGGHGITGMTERAAALGGELTAGPRPEGGFQVTARLPVAGPGGTPRAER